MKKALLKKELKKLYIETVSRTVNMIIDAEPESEEDSVYIISTLKDIALQKSANREICDAIIMEHPDLKELFSKEELIMTIRTQIQEIFDKNNI